MAVPHFSFRDLLLISLFILLSVLVWGNFYNNQSNRALYNPDAYSFAAAAREVVDENGFQTKSLILPQLDYLKKTGRDVLNWDSLYNFPLPVLLMALSFLIFGSGDFAISFSSGFFYFLSVPLVYLIARRRYNRAVASLTALVFVLFPHILRYSVSGMTELPSIFFTLLLLYLFTFGPNRLNLILGGLALGLFYLNRHTSLMFLPVFLAFIYQADPQQKRTNWSYFCVPFLFVISPWLWHMFKTTGNPFFHLGASILIPNETSLFPNFHVNLYTYYISPVEFILRYPGLAFIKYLKESLFLNWVLFALFLAFKRNIEKFDRLFLWLFFLVALVQPIFGNNPRYYALFAPLVLMYIIGMVERWLRRYSFVRPVLRFVFLAVIIIAVCFSSLESVWGGYRGIKEPGRGSGMVEHKLENMAILKTLVDRNKLAASNISSEVAWYADTKAMTLPPDPDSLFEFERHYGLSIDQLYLSLELHLPGLTPPGWAKWEEVRRTGLLAGYHVEYQFPNGSILLTKGADEIIRPDSL